MPRAWTSRVLSEEQFDSEPYRRATVRRLRALACMRAGVRLDHPTRVRFYRVAWHASNIVVEVEAR